MKAVVVHELSYRELKSRVEEAVKEILKRQRGSAAYITLKQVVLRAGFPRNPAYDTVVVETLRNLKMIDVNGRTWRLVEILHGRKTKRMRFVYRHRLLITDFLR